MKLSIFKFVALIVTLLGGQNAFALNASATSKNSHLYGYLVETNQTENDADISDLFRAASKDKAKKLVVFGGVHGYAGSGEPTGQSSAQKKACSFSLGDQNNKGVGTGINFIYVNLAKYTTNGSDVTPEKQREIKKLISGYLDGGYYVLLAWCYSRVWAESMGL